MQGSKALCQFIFSRQYLLQNIRHMEPAIYLCFGKQSSLIYNTSAKHEQYECDTSATLATRVRHEQHEFNTSATRVTWATRVLQNTSATRVLHERHEYDTSEKSKPSKGFQSNNGKILYYFYFIACNQFCVICIVSETTVLIFQEKST